MPSNSKYLVSIETHYPCPAGFGLCILSPIAHARISVSRYSLLSAVFLCSTMLERTSPFSCSSCLPPSLLFLDIFLFTSTRSGSDPWRQSGVDRVSSNSFPSIFHLPFLFFCVEICFLVFIVVWTADTTTVLYLVHLSSYRATCGHAALTLGFVSHSLLLLPQDDSKDFASHTYFFLLSIFCIYLALDVPRLSADSTTIQLEWDTECQWRSKARLAGGASTPVLAATNFLLLSPRKATRPSRVD